MTGFFSPNLRSRGFCPQDTGTYPLCSYDGSGQGACSGDWTGGVIADQVIVPKGLKPGKYVLWVALRLRGDRAGVAKLRGR